MVTDIVTAIIVCGLLLYAAISDAKKRIIPDLVPFVLLGIGFAALYAPENSIWQIPLLERAAGFALPTAALLVLYLLKKPVGGGDLKLSAALGFLLGLTQFAMVYIIGAVIALVWAKVKKQKSIPLAVFLMFGVVICLVLWM